MVSAQALILIGGFALERERPPILGRKRTLRPKITGVRFAARTTDGGQRHVCEGPSADTVTYSITSSARASSVAAIRTDAK